MLRVGLTGGIGSGKSTVAALFEQRGAAIVDADALAHELTASGGAAIDAIRAAFGAAAIRADGAMDRELDAPARVHRVRMRGAGSNASSIRAFAPCSMPAWPRRLRRSRSR